MQVCLIMNSGHTDYVSGCEKMHVTPEPPKFYRTEEKLKELEETEELR